MKNYTIENETNNITLHVSAKEAESVPGTQRFSTEATLARLAADWPASRLVEVWNTLPGATPVKKFKDRSTAVSRIWKAIQNVGAISRQAIPADAQALATRAPESAAALEPRAVKGRRNVQPEPAGAVVGAAPESNGVSAPSGQHAPESAPQTPRPDQEAGGPKKARKTAHQRNVREGSKTAQVIEMLKRDGGTTVEEIMAATGWQKHTTRAILSAGGTLTKNHGLVITSQKIGDGRRYSIGD